MSSLLSPSGELTDELLLSPETIRLLWPLYTEQQRQELVHAAQATLARLGDTP